MDHLTGITVCTRPAIMVIMIITVMATPVIVIIITGYIITGITIPTATIATIVITEQGLAELIKEQSLLKGIQRLLKETQHLRAITRPGRVRLPEITHHNAVQRLQEVIRRRAEAIAHLQVVVMVAAAGAAAEQEISVPLLLKNLKPSFNRRFFI